MKVESKTKFSRFMVAVVTTVLVATMAFILVGCGSGEKTTLNILAAASLTDALNELNEIYMEANDNIEILPNYASSGNLQTQIEQGAPADVFISAAPKQMNNLEEKGLILKETRRNLLTNKVVMIVPNNSTLGLTSFTDLTDSKVAKIAIGDPEFVPVGSYGKLAFEELGIWDELQSKFILCSDVRQVLSYVEMGNVEAGIVYSTDAAISGSVKIVADGPDSINSTIVYPAAVVEYSENPEAAGDYLDFLFSAEAKVILEKYGFAPIG